MDTSFVKYNTWNYFVLISGINVLLTLIISYLFNSDELYYQSFGEQMAANRIDKMIELSLKWQWIGYAFIPIVVLIRISFTSLCLYTGCLLVNLKVRFKELFNLALLADFIFILAGLTKLVILIFFKEVNTLEDLQFQPLSLLELFDRKSVDVLFIYPSSMISIFELLYWLTLTWLLTVFNELPFGSSLKTVASSYGSGLLLWVLFVMFLTVNLS
jgi:hypothetical protein